MIYKERNPNEHQITDKFSKAGADAEEQMAFYLRRAFVDSKDIHVFNDLRLQDDSGDAAQVDHLILHRHGFIVIESKSVSTKIRINQHGEFSRYWDGRFAGMPSPIQQAKLQIELLRRLLNRQSEVLLSKVMGLIRPSFRNVSFEVIIAISDRGEIERRTEILELIKADQVIDRIRDIFQRHKSASSIFAVKNHSPNDGLFTFKDDELYRMRRYLEENHTPLHPQQTTVERESATRDLVQEEPAAYGTPAQATPEPQTGEAPTLGQCIGCGIQSVIKWGKYGYYWNCLNCRTNMPIKEFCPTCGKKMKLRKDGMDFFKRCEPCSIEEHYCVFEVAEE